MGPLASTLLWIVVAAAVLAGLAYWLFGGRRRSTQPPRELNAPRSPAEDPAVAAFAAAAASGEPPTEDDIARARLGGRRGAPKLGEAPMSRQAREQMPRGVDDGHVA